MSSAHQRLGKYEVYEQVGRGGFATVFRARDTVLERDVALKILHPQLMTDREFVARFEADARTAAQLEHPHIVTIHELGQLDGRLYIAMQFMRDGTLHDRIEHEGRVPVKVAVQIIDQIARALDHAHTTGLIHRDVKPTNILFDGHGNAVLSDFGLVAAAEGSMVARSSAGGIIGTPAYIPPEIWDGKPATVAVDVYALGCVLFEMVTGEALYQRDTTAATIRSHFQLPSYPKQWPRDVSAGIEQVLNRALAEDPSARYKTAGALAADARSALAEREGASQKKQNQPPKPPPSPATSGQGSSRRRWLWLSCGASLALIVICVTVFAVGGLLADRNGRQALGVTPTTSTVVQISTSVPDAPTPTPKPSTRTPLPTQVSDVSSPTPLSSAEIPLSTPLPSDSNEWAPLPSTYQCPYDARAGWLPLQSTWYGPIGSGYWISYDTFFFYVYDPSQWNAVMNAYGVVVPYSTQMVRNQWTPLIGTPMWVCIDTGGQVFSVYSP